jgi:chaperonin GroEL
LPGRFIWRTRRRIWARRCCGRAPENTGEAVGDGTSTSVVLAHALCDDGVRNVVVGASASDLKRGLERAAKAVDP